MATESGGRSRRRRVLRLLANLLIVAGALALIWSFWVWRYGDPITGYYQKIQQHRLAREYDRVATTYAAKPIVPQAVTTTPVVRRAVLIARLRAAAARYRASVAPGRPVGRLRVPRFGLNAVVVDGTGHSDLERGPGRDARTYMPGQGELVYVAGHRTTYGAPFAHIDSLRGGDHIFFTVPYARIEYVVVTHRIVPADALDQLHTTGQEILRLQACHPRFFATHRYIVDAVPLRATLTAKNGQTAVISYPPPQTTG